MKYAYNLALLVKEEKVLRGMFDSLIEIGRCCGKERKGKERKVEKAKVMSISKQLCPVVIIIDEKLLNVEYFSYFGRIATDEARCTRDLRSRFSTYKQHST